MKSIHRFFFLVTLIFLLNSCTSEKSNQVVFTLPIEETGTQKTDQIASVQHTPDQTTISNKRRRASLTKTILFDKLGGAVQKFEFPSIKHTTLTGSKGTKLTIKKNSFLLNGNPYLGSVLLQLKECYSYSDMVLHNLNTCSNNRMLESGGMICLEALSSDHQRLTLDNHHPIELQMPSESPKPYMQLFYADKNMNWVQASDSKPQFATVLNNKKQRSSDIRSGNYFITANGFGTVITTVSILKDGKEKELSSTSYANQALYQPGQDSLTLYFEMDEYGSLYNSVIQDTAFTKNITISAHKLESMNDASLTYYSYTAGNMRFTDCNLLLKGELKNFTSAPSIYFVVPRTVYTKIKNNANRADRTKVIVRNTYIFRSNGLDSRQEKLKEIQAKLDSSDGVKNISTQDLQYYAFSIHKLGWINCDRFYNIPDAQKINFTFANEDGTDLKLVFADIKSVLTGDKVNDKIVFRNVPKNKPVTIVGIRIVNEKAELAILKTTTQKVCEEQLIYTPVSVEELKEKIKTTF